jgi:hypothetical protein
MPSLTLRVNHMAGHKRWGEVASGSMSRRFLTSSTCTVVGWLPVFTRPETVQVLERHKSDRAFQLWQEGSHPQVIENEEVLRQKLEYIHENPVRRVYFGDPTDWRYSSARNYARIEALVSVSTDW